ncbi:hypothetical protein [Nocardioides sp. AE5]|uniref:hypothetical protein n=1 Tax=Nocardioides sp. AE5 TaxID=2962573 RepID=UPI0028820E22|nr:hypothetical protein [Nocardioides sp. AE5]MDT0202161.1 hypothetical protein [Nocardioides sp. AE5]
MSLLSRPGLVLVEVAISAGVVAYVFRGIWLPVGISIAVIALALALVPIHGRPLHKVLASWIAVRARRGRLRGPGVAAIVGADYDVVAVPTAGALPIGAIRDATTWAVPLSLPLNHLSNDDAPIPLDRLATLLMVEDVPLASVRLVTMLSPGNNHSAATGPVPPLPRLATRHLVLTLDTIHASDAIVGRGGQAGIPQILRRCVMRAEEVLASSGIEVRRLPDRVVAIDSASALGPMSVPAEGNTPQAIESLATVTIQDVVSSTWLVSGADALARLDQLAAALAVPIVATSVVLEPGPRQRDPHLTLLLRMSGSAAQIRSAGADLARTSRAMDLRVRHLPGEQVPSLRATTLVGVGSTP